MKNKNMIWIIGGAALLVWYLNTQQPQTSTVQKRQQLAQFIQSGGDSDETKAKASNLFLNVMTDAEIAVVYEFIFKYLKAGKSLQPGSALYTQFTNISAKYGIFS